MAQDSFPKGAGSGASLQDNEWKLLMMAVPDGIIDMGGYPYLLTTKNNATNELTIGVDQRTGYNQAVMHGFVHIMDAPEKVVIPPVTTGTKVYCVGLVYDPLKHSNAKGPVSLTVWEAPGDFTQGKARLVLFRITRAANQLLSNATFEEEKQRVSPGIAVNKRADLPREEMTRTDTVALIRQESKLVRLDRPSSGPPVWIDVVTSDPALNTATSRATPDTLVKRGVTGAIEVATRGAAFGDDAANVNFVKDYVSSNGAQGSTGASPGLMARNNAGQTSVGAGTAGPHAVNKAQLDAAIATRTPFGHGHNATDLNKNGPDVWWEIVSGSTDAYTQTSGGPTWATVAVSSAGKFFRYPSALKYKTNVRRYLPSVEDALAIEPVTYDAKDTGIKGYIGVVADAYVETFPNLVQFDDKGEVEGWHYQLWPTVQQVVLRDLDRRAKEQAARIEALEARADAQDKLIAGLVEQVKALQGRAGKAGKAGPV